MLNEFRTKLINVDDTGDKTENIPSGYTSRVLTTPLQQFYDLIYPTNSSRFYKLFLTHNYVSLIHAAGLFQETLKNDPRISYDLTEEIQFFKFTRTSNPIVSNNLFPIAIAGSFNNNVTANNFYDHIVISQRTNTLLVDVFSNVNQIFHVSGATLSFVSGNTGTSSSIDIGMTGLSFQILARGNFTNTSGKTWEFIAEAPYRFDFNDIYTKLTQHSEIVDRMLLEPNLTKNMSPDKIWKGHFNPVYKVAGLLIAYTNRIK